MLAPDAARGTACEPDTGPAPRAPRRKPAARSRLLPPCAAERVARGARRLGMAVRAQPLGRAWDRHEKRRLGRGQMRRLLAEIGKARGAHPFEIAAERRQGQIDAEDLDPSTAGVRVPAPRPSRRAFATSVRGRRSSSRTACIVRVEAPDTTWPCSPAGQGARNGHRIDARDARRSAGPRWRSACGDRAGRPPRLDRQPPFAVGREKPAQDRLVAASTSAEPLGATERRRRQGEVRTRSPQRRDSAAKIAIRCPASRGEPPPSRCRGS